MKADNRLTTAFIRNYPVEAARALERLPAETIARMFDSLDRKSAGRLLGNMMPEPAAASLGCCGTRLAADLLEEVSASAAARILRTAAAGRDNSLYQRLLQHDKSHVYRMTRYPLDRVGAHMKHADNVYPDDLNPRDILRMMRWKKPSAACEVWLVDRGYRLSGVAQVTDLLQAGADDTVRSLMGPARMSLPVRMTLSVARAQPAWDAQRRLPVIDDDGVLVGVIDYETLLQATRTDVEPDEHRDAMDSMFALARIYWTATATIIDTLLKSPPTKPSA